MYPRNTFNYLRHLNIAELQKIQMNFLFHQNNTAQIYNGLAGTTIQLKLVLFHFSQITSHVKYLQDDMVSGTGLFLSTRNGGS